MQTSFPMTYQFLGNIYKSFLMQTAFFKESVVTLNFKASQVTKFLGWANNFNNKSKSVASKSVDENASILKPQNSMV